MVRVTVHGHRPACLSSAHQVDTQAASAPCERHSDHLSSAASSSSLPPETVRQVNLGLIKLKIHRHTPMEALLRGQTQQKIQQKAQQAPYLSNSGVPEVRLNCRVLVRSDTSMGSETGLVACRHLATMFVERTGKASEMMQAFSTEDGIAAMFDEKLMATDLAYKRAFQEATPNCKHLFGGSQLGRYLQATAAQLQDPREIDGVSQVNCLLVTADHAMALHVERKSKNGIGYFAAKLYDPNETATYRRVVKAAPEDFADLRIGDLMTRPEWVHEYSGGPDKALSIAAVCLDPKVQPSMGSCIESPTPETMHMALSMGMIKDLPSMLDSVLSSDKQPEEIIEILQARSQARDVEVPGLMRALASGHINTVTAFTQSVLDSKLDLPAKVDLLSAKLNDQITGLCMALVEGQTEVFTSFTKLILNSRLTSRGKAEILASPMDDERTVFFFALENGHADAVKGFIRAVADANISPQVKLDLLLAKRRDGRPGLCMAFEKGHAQAVGAFAEELLASPRLTTPAKLYLLRAERTDGRTPGLFMALQDGKVEAVRTFASTILNSSALNGPSKVRLLAAKRGEDETPGFFMALQEGQDDAVRAFAQEVLASNLSDDEKMQLLAAKCSRGISGAQVAADLERDGTLGVFADIVMGSSLSNLQKTELLNFSVRAPAH